MAGLEADKTNELLVAISKAIDRKIDSTEAVALVKSGNVPTAAPKKDAKASKAQTKSDPRKAKKETKDSKEPSTSKKTKTTTDGKSVKKPESNAKVSKQSSKDSVESKKSKKSLTQTQDKENDRKKERDRTATIKPDGIETVPIAVEKPIETTPINENVVSGRN